MNLGTRWSTEHWVTIFFAVVASIVTLVFIGWQWNIDCFKSVFPGYISMKANTAAGAFILTLGIWLNRAEGTDRRRQWAGVGLGGLAALLGALTLVEYLFGRDFHIDEFFFLDPDAIGGRFPPGRLAPISALTFMTLGGASALLYNPWRPFSKTAQFLGVTGFLISIQALAGYICGVSYSFGKAYYTQMALHTTLLFACASLGLLLSRPEKGFMIVLTSRGPGGKIARSLIASAILVPPLVHWLQLRGIRAGLYDENFGVLIQVIGNVTFFIAMVWRSALTLHRTDELRKASEDARNEILISEKSAREATRLKSEFLANMSHEIRTPLNGILGMTGILLESGLDPQRKEYASMVLRSGEALLALVNDILDFTKIEAGKIDLEAVDFELKSTLLDLQSTFSFAAKKKGLDLRLNVDERTPLYLKGDPSRLRQILVNLLGNAIKFTGTGTVCISSEVEAVNSESVTLRFEVRDSGIGISDEAMRRLFQPFTQADSSTTRKFGGTGLGLSISKRLVERMGGQIGVESVPGEGSRFWFVLELPIGIRPALLPGGADAIALNQRYLARVLVAEDNAVNQMIARKMLEKLGLSVSCVNNGAEALRELSLHPFDLVLMDCQMPEMDGFEATKRIRGLPEPHRAIPILAMTANAMKGDREKCLDAGMDDYIAKPMNGRLLATLLLKWAQELEKRSTRPAA